MFVVAAIQPGAWRRHAWLVPAVPAATAISLLCWGAWTYGYDPGWLIASHAWWVPCCKRTRTGRSSSTMALLLGGSAPTGGHAAAVSSYRSAWSPL